MKTCLIYGHNGLDLDVTLNLRSFYRQLGFLVSFSDKLYDANLLVVVRAINKPIDLNNFTFTIIHVYDYGGWDYDNFVLSINKQITYYFCTSELKKQKLTNLLSVPEDHVYIALPPVDVKLWSKKIKPIKYNFVHIGNFKPIAGEDVFKLKFNNAIDHFKSNLWGAGWDICNDYYRGKAGLFQVSDIYRQSKYAFGLMYPFQREVTFSGRFWHAPLNGCMLISEPGLYTQNIPGIIEVDYSQVDIQQKIANGFDREQLQTESQVYWSKQYLITKGYVIPTLNSIRLNKTGYSKILIYIYLYSLNILAIYFQKTRLFNLIKKNKK